MDISRPRFAASVALLSMLVLVSGCRTRQNDPHPVAASTTCNGQEYLIGATIFMQHSSEYRALCYQTFNTARESLDHILMTSRFAKPPCVVLDIDETVLDNSPYTGYQIKYGKPFSPESWKEWTDMAAADTMPGVGTFLRHAKSKGMEIFYVSNRKIDERPATVENLRKMGLPDADTNHVFLRTDSASKEPRRARIRETNAIVLLFGDNLGDLSDAFEDLPTTERRAQTDAHRDYFGKTWFVLPNPVYGSWNSALFNYERLEPSQQDSVRREKVRSFK